MRLANATAAAALYAINLLLNGGRLDLYSGSPPRTPETAATGTRLASFAFASSAFGQPSAAGEFQRATGTLVATGISPITSGKIGYARAYRSDGATVVADYTVGIVALDGSTSLQGTDGADLQAADGEVLIGAGPDIVISTLDLATGITVRLTSFAQRFGVQEPPRGGTVATPPATGGTANQASFNGDPVYFNNDPVTTS